MKYYFISKRAWDKEFTCIYVYKFVTGYCIVKDLNRDGMRTEHHNWEALQKIWLIPNDIKPKSYSEIKK